MALTNPWVGYAQRTYQTIKDAVITVLPTLIPEMTDLSESNPFIKILSIWCGIAEMLSYYIDNAARESHLISCRLFKSGVRHAQANDYRVHINFTATGDVLFTLDNPAPSDILIPQGTQVNNATTAIDYYTVEDCTIATGTDNISVGISQGAASSITGLGVSAGTPNMVIQLTDTSMLNMAEKPVVYVNGVAWTHVDTFGFSMPTDQVYMVTVDINSNFILVFGDGVTGKIPPTGQTLSIKWFNTVADAGNTTVNTVTTIVGAVSVPVGYTLSVTNPNEVTGGTPVETLAQLKQRIPQSLRTLYRAVTRQDYIDVAELFTGVGKANVDYGCGKKVTLYIVPVGGGLASTPLCSDTYDWMDDKKMITTGITVLPAGSIEMIYSIDITTLPNYVMTDVKADVLANLLAFHNYLNQSINGIVQLSDIYQLVETTDGVSYSKINRMTPVPYGMITSGTDALLWTVAIQPASADTNYWDIVFTGSGNYQLSKNGSYIGTFAVGTLVTQPEVQFTVNTYAYSIGDAWRFYTYPYFGTLVLVEQSIPATDPSLITLNMSGGL